MTEWKEVLLGDVLEVKYGKDHKGLNNGQIPCLGSGGIMRYVDNYLYNDESILIPRKGSLNNIMYQNNPFWTVDTMFWTKIEKSKVIPKFLYYQLTLIDYINLNVGSAVPSLTVPVINEIEINLPPLPEQKAIAETLSSLDDKIDLLHRQNRTLEQMAETLFRQWFVEEAKEDWEEGTLGNLIDIDTGFAFKSKFYEKEGNLRVVRGKNVTIGSLRWGTDAKFWNESVEGLERYFLKKWDIVIGMDGSRIGQNRSLVLESDLPAILAQRVARLRAKRIKQQPFIWKHIFSEDFKEYISAIHTGTSIPHISQGQILDYEILLPPNELIDKYSEIVQSFWDKYEQNSTQIQNLEQMRDTLLPKLMSGEVTITA